MECGSSSAFKKQNYRQNRGRRCVRFRVCRVFDEKPGRCCGSNAYPGITFKSESPIGYCLKYLLVSIWNFLFPLFCGALLWVFACKKVGSIPLLFVLGGYFS